MAQADTSPAEGSRSHTSALACSPPDRPLPRTATLAAGMAASASASTSESDASEAEPSQLTWDYFLPGTASGEGARGVTVAAGRPWLSCRNQTRDYRQHHSTQKLQLRLCLAEKRLAPPEGPEGLEIPGHRQLGSFQ